MTTVQELKERLINKAQQIAKELHSITGFTYRVRWIFNGANIECWSKQKSKWITVKTVQS